MIHIVEWLIGQEHTAGKLYDDASMLFKEDKELFQFLADLSEDEAWHYHAMASGLDYLKSVSPQISSDISLDGITTSKLEAPFIEIRTMIAGGSLSKEAVLDCIASAEFHEWNDIFLYAINVLKAKKREFRFVASKIEQHKKHIIRFFETLDSNSAYLAKIRHLPEVWKHKILVVADYEPMRELLSAVFCDEGIVHTAVNGQEGLARMTEQYYDLIISDVDMPVMNGIEFNRQATLKFGPLANRFLFYINFPASENTLDFLEINKLRYLIKPAPLQVIKATVHEMLLNKSQEVAA